MPEMRERPFIAEIARGRDARFVPPVKETEFSTYRIDWYAVERVLNGGHPLPPLNPDELREAALWLRRHDVERHAVSVRLNVYERRIKDWEAEAGMLPADQLCARGGCKSAAAGRGLCANHLQQQRWAAKRQQLEAAA
ncbi:hypothetical protein [Streptomyces sp. M41(2017)]|uniref:hypothetical protein n=1 Tax=Streptomyces sp. M41(2017) TaxID=1955065 RepID=UPI00117FE142|nr:hypothetical protein [Streptomyces sp. M41(2017)]